MSILQPALSQEPSVYCPRIIISVIFGARLMAKCTLHRGQNSRTLERMRLKADLLPQRKNKVNIGLGIQYVARVVQDSGSLYLKIGIGEKATVLDD